MHFLIGIAILAVLVYTKIGRVILVAGTVTAVLAFFYYTQPEPASVAAQYQAQTVPTAKDCVRDPTNGDILDKILRRGCPGVDPN